MSELTGREAAVRFGGAGTEALDRLVAITAAGGDTARIRHAAAEATGLPPLPGAAPGEHDAVFAFARQFATDVSSLDADTRAAFLAATGSASFGIVQTLYPADLVPRAVAVLGALFDGPGSWPDAPPVEVDAGTMWAAVEAVLLEVHRLDALDPVLTEVVRLYGARSHDCRLCRSLRSRPALAAGATDAVFDAVDLTAAQRAAVDLTDAFIWHPAHLDADLVARVRAELSPPQIVELVLDVLRNASNKIAVALGADDPHVTEGVEIYEIDPDGVAHCGLTAP